MVELRGVGLSRAPRGVKQTFGVDYHLRYDLPAAVEYMLKTHSASQLHWVGHSMGAMLGYIYGGAFSERLASLVAVAGPVPRAVPIPLRQLLLPLRHILTRAPLNEIPNRWGLVALKRVPKLARLAYDGVLFCSENLSDEWLVKVADHALENVPLSVLHRLGEWVSTTVRTRTRSSTRSARCSCRRCSCALRSIRSARRMSSSTQAGSCRRATRARASSPATTAFTPTSAMANLLVSPAAKREVYPLVLEFIAEHEAKILATAASS